MNQRKKPPLVIDLDGTLIRNDLTQELALKVVATNPANAPQVLMGALRSKADIKDYLNARVGESVAVEHLPFRDEVTSLAKSYSDDGHEVYVCSGSHDEIVQRLVDSFDWIDGGWGTRDGLNLISSNKTQHLVEQFPDGFHYVGNSTADYAVWEAAAKGYAVDPPRSVEKVRSAGGDPVEVIASDSLSFRGVLKMMRVHQWAKNGLMFVVPFLVFAQLTLRDVVNVGLGFLAFSLLASATYILNDMVDIDNDRQHATKRNRMLASGRMSLAQATLLMGGLGVASLMIAAFLPQAFWVVMAVYLVVTLLYSFRVKRIAIADVLTLAGLFTLRVYAGATLVAVAVSPWLLNFIAIFFLNLALVKRYTELRKKPALITADGTPAATLSGRGYMKSDEPIVLSLGVSMAALALLSFFLYGVLAPNRAIEAGLAIGVIAAILIYWTMRVWLLAHRGQMNDDPVLFALKDRLSVALGVVVFLVIIADRLIW